MSMAERTTESGEQMRDWAAIPRMVSIDTLASGETIVQ
jgi:hypothetical protein